MVASVVPSPLTTLTSFLWHLLILQTFHLHPPSQSYLHDVEPSAWLTAVATVSPPSMQILEADDRQIGDDFGKCISFVDNLVLTGSPYNGPQDFGAAYFFQRSGYYNYSSTSPDLLPPPNTNAIFVPVWRPRVKLQADDPASSDLFGFSVSLTQYQALIGAKGKNSNAGAVYLFQADFSQLNASLQWTLSHKWLASSEPSLNLSTAAEFGYAVTLGQDLFVVSAPGDSENRGTVLVFGCEVFDSGICSSWSFRARLVAQDGASQDRFGVAVALTPEVIVVGSPAQQNSIYIFQRQAPWSQLVKLSASTSQVGDNFGLALSAAHDNTIVVGAPNYSSYRGAAYVFQPINDTKLPWQLVATLTAASSSFNDVFGSSVAMTDQYIAIGAPGSGLNVGSGYVFSETSPRVFSQTRFHNPNSLAADYVGASIAIGEDRTLIVGAPAAGNLRSGQLFVFEGEYP